MLGKKGTFFPLNGKNKKKIYFFSVNFAFQNISPHVLKISAISRVHSTGEITDIFNTFNIFSIHLKKKISSTVIILNIGTDRSKQTVQT